MNILNSARFDQNQAIDMEELLQRLETKVKDLLDQQLRIKHSHDQLYHGQFTLIREKEMLSSKHAKAITQIERDNKFIKGEK